jgi:hypothetical protein
VGNRPCRQRRLLRNVCNRTRQCWQLPNGNINVSGALKTEDTDGVEEGEVTIEGTSQLSHHHSPTSIYQIIRVYEVLNSVPVASTMTITPVKDDNPLNGVTTYDLVLISKHILGIEPLGSPYKMIAADANKSNSITTFDIVEIRKLILGIYTELPEHQLALCRQSTSVL